MTTMPVFRAHLAILVRCAIVHAAIAVGFIPGIAKAATPTPGLSARSAAVSLLATAPKGALPPAVAAMRDAILEAVQSGHLDDLKYALELNEIKPELAADPVPDPIAYWRSVSADGTGHDILAGLGNLLDSPPAIVPLGKDPENPAIFIWPAFADRVLANLTEGELDLLHKLEPPAKSTAMVAAKKYTGWRLVIGADGVWHSFRRYD